ncbi:MAG TPA: hypothetical protein VFO25_05260 [Candidatus Eremiobacteraceae bacterium]|nr:hypothetical protein [Candidatus Eremiobacteraceae bacterium]
MHDRPRKPRARIFGLVSIVFFSIIGVTAAGWFGYSGLTWMHYGSPQAGVQPNVALDHFMPVYEVDEQQDLAVGAPWTNTFAAECLMDLQNSAVIHAVIEDRARILGATPDPQASGEPSAFVAQAISYGWGVLAEDPGHEIILGAVSQPWEQNVAFQSLPPDEFASYQSAGYAKIVWTLDAEPTGPSTSIARTVTRVETTDPDSRDKFRSYWAKISPGMALIRSQALALVRADAEQSYQANGEAAPTTCEAIESAAGH